METIDDIVAEHFTKDDQRRYERFDQGFVRSNGHAVTELHQKRRSKGLLNSTPKYSSMNAYGMFFDDTK